MDTITVLTERNDDFAEHRFPSGLTLMPALKTLIIGCVDPRVDPAHVLGVALGDAAIIRNVGGRVTPATVAELVMLRKVTQAGGGDMGTGWDLVVLHHTQCGITRLGGEPAMLSAYFGVGEQELPAKRIDDPRAAVAVDVEALRSSPSLAGGFLVSGLVYDVATGRTEVVVPPALLRETAGVG
ncbi:carbonic anhydrase [Actinomycetospora sp.]|uniref:carbonic anhydrase n=1 Tax=Actinomycetospora sp. TaxID=1872135 RepID=UPI002F3EAE92